MSAEPLGYSMAETIHGVLEWATMREDQLGSGSTDISNSKGRLRALLLFVRVQRG